MNYILNFWASQGHFGGLMFRWIWRGKSLVGGRRSNMPRHYVTSYNMLHSAPRSYQFEDDFWQIMSSWEFGAAGNMENFKRHRRLVKKIDDLRGLDSLILYAYDPEDGTRRWAWDLTMSLIYARHGEWNKIAFRVGLEKGISRLFAIAGSKRTLLLW